MKHLSTLLAGLALCLAPMLTSCSEDDPEDFNPAAQAVAGTYRGDMTCSVMGQESVFEGMSATLAAQDESTATLTLSSFGTPPMQIPGITISGIKVSEKDGGYVLAPTEFSQESGGRKCSGTLSGSVEGSLLSMRISLQYGAMPMPLICTLTASRQ